MEEIIDERPELVFIQETWLKTLKSDATSIVKDYGYVLVHEIRKNIEKETGGGVGIMIKLGMKYEPVKQRKYSSFEHIVVRIPIKSCTPLLVISIYRVLFVPVNVFLEEFVTLLEILVTMKENFVIAGDINIHMDAIEIYSSKFNDILDSFNLQQHVEFPTHIRGHTLDVIITNNEVPCISKVGAKEYHDISHHSLVSFNVNVTPLVKTEKRITFRNIKGIILQNSQMKWREC